MKGDKKLKSQRFGIEIEFTGITRCKAAKKVAEFFNTKSEHIGGGYDAYQAKDSKGRDWKIVSDSSITAEKKENGGRVFAGPEYRVELVSPILIYEDIEPLQELIRSIAKAGAITNNNCGLHIHIEAANHTPRSLRNLVNLMASKEDLIYKALEIDAIRVRYCKQVEETLLVSLNKKKPKTLEDFADIWYEDYASERRSKHYHLSRYHGLNLHTVFSGQTVEFRLFNSTTHAGKIKAYIQFCLAVSHQAIIQKSASGKRTITDNEKYTFRCWLLRLGLIGEEFETCRYHLLAHLEGNSAWRHAA